MKGIMSENEDIISTLQPLQSIFNIDLGKTVDLEGKKKKYGSPKPGQNLRKTNFHTIQIKKAPEPLSITGKVVMKMKKGVIEEIPEELPGARHTNYSKMTGSQNSSSGFGNSSMSFLRRK